MTELEHATVRITSFGDAALLIRPESTDALTRWSASHGIATAVRDAAVPGVLSAMATFDTATIEFDPVQTDPMALAEWIRELATTAQAPTSTGRIVTIPVCYGGDYGPDLQSVAQHLGTTESDVIERHSQTLWRVAFTGAPAGTPLHESDAFPSPIPRMPEPRLRVPEGSIAVSGFQGTIYTVGAPGGWRLLGRTPLHIINTADGPFTYIEPGDSLRFTPVSEREFAGTAPVFIGSHHDAS